MNFRTANLLWILLALTQAWYYVLPLFAVINATDSVTQHIYDVIYAVCEFPIASSTFVCRALMVSDGNDTQNDATKYTSAIDSGFESLQDLLSNRAESSLAIGFSDVRTSIDDAVFLVKSSKMDCHEKMVEEFNDLVVGSAAVNEGLMEFKARAHSSIDFVIAATDHLLYLISLRATVSFGSVFCGITNAMRLRTCSDSPGNILRAFTYTIQKLESIVAILSEEADALDIGLDHLEGHLRVIRDLLSDEAGTVMDARDDILGTPWYWMGRHSRRLLHYNTRMQAVYDVKLFRNAASTYVSSVRGRLHSVETELKVLSMLAGEPDRANEVLPLKAFVEALRSGIFRLQEAQLAFSGRSGGSDRVSPKQLAGQLQGEYSPA